MRRGTFLAAALGFLGGWLAVQACGTNTPTLPGEFLGTFLFSGTLVAEASATGDAGASQLVTTCLVAIPLADGGSVTVADGGDGGSIGPFFFPTSPQFYAQISLLPDAGQIVWQLIGPPPQDGGLLRENAPVEGGDFTIVTFTEALVSGCNCTAGLTETITLHAGAGGLVPGVSLLSGTIDDRLDPDAGLSSDGGPACVSDAGLGCQLGCDLVYVITGVPGRP